MTDATLFAFGAVVSFIFAAGCYLILREDAARRHEAAEATDRATTR